MGTEDLKGQLIEGGTREKQHNIGDQEFLGLREFERKQFGLLANLTYTTSKSLLYTQVSELAPYNLEKHKPEFIRRSEIVDKVKNDSPYWNTQKSNTTIYQFFGQFVRSGYVTQETRSEVFSGMAERFGEQDVVYMAESELGYTYARKAAYLAQIFEYQFGLPLIAINTAVVEEGTAAEDASYLMGA